MSVQTNVYSGAAIADTPWYAVMGESDYVGNVSAQLLTWQSRASPRYPRVSCPLSPLFYAVTLPDDSALIVFIDTITITSAATPDTTKQQLVSWHRMRSGVDSAV